MLVVWGALLGAFRIHGNVKMENELLNKFLNWILKMLQAMCWYETHVYAASGNWDLRENVQ
jgi:hypothetical protein